MSISDVQKNMIINRVYSEIDSLKVPKIEPINPFDNLPAFKEEHFLISGNQKISDKDFKEYLNKYKANNNNSTFHDNYAWIVDDNKSVKWNKMGYNHLIEENKKKRERLSQTILDSIKQEGYNNKAEIKRFKNQVITIFVNLLSEVTILSDKSAFDNACKIKVCLSPTDERQLKRFLNDVTSTSKLDTYRLTYTTPKFHRIMKKTARKVILDLQSGTLIQ